MATFPKTIYEVFCIDDLKDIQKETLDALLSQTDVYLSIKTGGGKSLCYQAFPSCWTEKHGTDCKVLIVSPLVSIMKEQSEFLKSIGFTATYIGKDNNDENLLAGNFQFIFTSPESILSISKWRDMLTSPSYKNLQLIVVDEAHTVLQWGESAHGDNPFREWYGKLGEIRSLTECPVLLITAIANEAARKNMRKKFSMVNYVEIIDNPDRENVKLFLKRVKSSVPLSEIFSFLTTILKKEKGMCPRYIIFCTSIKTCGDLFSMFRLELKEDIKYLQMYHSKTPDPVKEYVKQEMSKEDGQLRILIATSAAGMGVNFYNLNQIINFGPPKDMDSFVQQTGRAGRNSNTTAMAILIYTGRQCRNIDEDMKKYINNDSKCRREIILSAYNAKPNSDRVGHSCCDLCSVGCKCNEEDCATFDHPYNLNVNDSEDVSSTESNSQSDLSSDF